MKSKFNIWLNIVTMCLCVCAITIGIYSLKQVNLTVSGSIGFVSSKIKYDVTAQMKGYMTKSGDVETFHDEFESLDVNTNANDEKSIALSEIYFSNPEGSETVSDIVIELTITNNSSYPIEATLGLPNNETILTNVDFTKSQNIVAQMGTTTDNGKTQTMTINMSLSGTELTSTPVAFNFSITLNKFEQIQYDENIGYYTTMGSHIVGSGTSQEVKEVKWLPIARYNAEYTETDLYNYEPFDYTTELDSGSYYFISEKILDIGTAQSYEEYYGESIYGVGVSFNSYEYDDELGFYCDTTYSGYSANNYLVSNVRKLLKGDTVKQYATSGENVNLINEYGLCGYTFDSITERSTSEMLEYNTDQKKYDDLDSALKTTDKLWLLSLTEVNRYNLDSKILFMQVFQNELFGYWWTRSGSTYWHNGVLGGQASTNIGNHDDFLNDLTRPNGIHPVFILKI